MAIDRAPALPVVAMGLDLLEGPLTRYQIDAAAQLNALAADGLGYRWPKAVILWPRQTGKTTTILLVALARVRALRDYRCAYAAQTGHITSQRFTEWISLIQARPGWAHDWRTRSSDGTERITGRASRGYLRAFPPIPGRLRSNALDMPVVDEAQEHSDDRVGAKLDADILPTMSTRRRAQWIVAGTAGDASSSYFLRHYELAAAGTPGHLLLEIGTPPEDADLEDPTVWAAYHPGVRAGLTTIDKLAEARASLGPDRFAREYFNRWSKALIASLFPVGTWRTCHRPDAGIDGKPSLSLEVAPDRAQAAIVAAGPSTAGPGLIHVELVTVIPLELIAPVCKQLADRNRTPIHVDPMAPAVTHLDALRRAKVPVRRAEAVDLVTAAGLLYDRVAAGTLTHLDQPMLSAAAAASAQRRIGARWAFDRYAPGGHIITAAALAALAAERAPVDAGPALLS